VKQIFDPFFTTKRNQGGTGLGLSIAYGIIKEHKGRIEVDSKPGSGTTFSIFIPVVPKEST
jgi:signal transduction histidine kinase